MTDKVEETPRAEDSRALSQNEIDDLLGLDRVQADNVPKTGIQSMLENVLLTYDRLPMLEIVFDRFVRMTSTTLRNYTSDNVDVDTNSITSLRFGDYINSIPMPALLSIFKSLEWDNFAILTIDSSLVYSMVDVLFGGRKTSRPIRVEGRPYTTIEQMVVRQLSELILTDLAAAFDPLSPTTFEFERLETNPRFASISHPADAAILLQLRVDMEDRGGTIEILFPYTTLEPIKDLLTQVFMGEKFGKDSLWENHIGKEINFADVEVEALLGEKNVSMEDIFSLKVGSTIVLNQEPNEALMLRCQGVDMFKGKLGRVGEKVAVSIDQVMNRRIKRGI